MWEGLPQRAARTAHHLGFFWFGKGGRSLQGRVGSALGNPHDGSEVGLQLDLNARACGDEVDSEEQGGGAVQLGSRVLLTIPSAVRDNVSLSERPGGVAHRRQCLVHDPIE